MTGKYRGMTAEQIILVLEIMDIKDMPIEQKRRYLLEQDQFMPYQGKLSHTLMRQITNDFEK